MMNTRLFCTGVVLLAATLAAPHGFCQSAPAPAGQQSPALGLLEGTLLSSDGQVVSRLAYSPGSKHLHGVRHGGGEFDAQTDEKTAYAPQRLFGIVVKPGARTVLDIVMHQGTQVEEVGSPVITTNAAIPLSAELAQLQQQAKDLSQQVADLKQQMEALKKQVANLQRQAPVAQAKVSK